MNNKKIKEKEKIDWKVWVGGIVTMTLCYVLGMIVGGIIFCR